MEDAKKHKCSDADQDDDEKREPNDDRQGKAKKFGTDGGELGDAKKNKSYDSGQVDSKNSKCEHDTGKQRELDSKKRKHDVDFYPFSM